MYREIRQHIFEGQASRTTRSGNQKRTKYKFKNTATEAKMVIGVRS